MSAGWSGFKFQLHLFLGCVSPRKLPLGVSPPVKRANLPPGLVVRSGGICKGKAFRRAHVVSAFEGLPVITTTTISRDCVIVTIIIT